MVNSLRDVIESDLSRADMRNQIDQYVADHSREFLNDRVCNYQKNRFHYKPNKFSNDVIWKNHSNKNSLNLSAVGLDLIAFFGVPFYSVHISFKKLKYINLSTHKVGHLLTKPGHVITIAEMPKTQSSFTIFGLRLDTTDERLAFDIKIIGAEALLMHAKT